MKSVIIGFGEIGKAVNEVIKKTDRVSTYDIHQDNGRSFDTVNIMHICFPYTENFVKEVTEYKAMYQPEHILIWSTVPIGTSKRLKATHTPVEGKHPNLAESIKTMVRWFSTSSHLEAIFFSEYFENLGLTHRWVENTDWTEALKLLSTSEYGINIVFAGYKAQIAKALGMDYNLMQMWNVDYNDLYKKLNLPKYQKFVLEPPEGQIGGHCIRENSILLDKDFPNDMLKMIYAMKGTNEKIS